MDAPATRTLMTLPLAALALASSSAPASSLPVSIKKTTAVRHLSVLGKTLAKKKVWIPLALAAAALAVTIGYAMLAPSVSAHLPEAVRPEGWSKVKVLAGGTLGTVLFLSIGLLSASRTFRSQSQIYSTASDDAGLENKPAAEPPWSYTPMERKERAASKVSSAKELPETGNKEVPYNPFDELIEKRRREVEERGPDGKDGSKTEPQPKQPDSPAKVNDEAPLEEEPRKLQQPDTAKHPAAKELPIPGWFDTCPTAGEPADDSAYDGLRTKYCQTVCQKVSANKHKNSPYVFTYYLYEKDRIFHKKEAKMASDRDHQSLHYACQIVCPSEEWIVVIAVETGPRDLLDFGGFFGSKGDKSGEQNYRITCSPEKGQSFDYFVIPLSWLDKSLIRVPWLKALLDANIMIDEDKLDERHLEAFLGQIIPT